jgi:hypothetical protein
LKSHEFWALMFPAMLPPPAPFKIVVLAAAAFEMNFGHFLLAIFAGRFVRFLIEALLTLWFGPQIVTLMGNFSRTTSCGFWWGQQPSPSPGCCGGEPSGLTGIQGRWQAMIPRSRRRGKSTSS